MEAVQPVQFHAPRKVAAAGRSGVSQRQWSVGEVAELLELPFNDLLFQAQSASSTRGCQSG